VADAETVAVVLLDGELAHSWEAISATIFASRSR
jgi:hypothetical protein